MIDFSGVSKTFPGGTVAVERLDLTIAEGELCVLIGPSGCGKTTIMRMINRLVEPTVGTISVDGVDTSTLDPVELRRGIGYVIQQVGLFPHQRIGTNVGTVCRLSGWSRKATEDRVDELLKTVGLEPAIYRERFPHQLSGGQRQRVGVARALAADPPVLLMDEPFGAIDPVTRGRLQDEFLSLQQTLAKTIVFVTHDLDEAIKLGDRIALLGPGGRLRQLATPTELLTAPADDEAEAFVGSDRALKRLAIATLDEVGNEPTPNDLDPTTLPRVPASASIRDALAASLLHPSGFVVVDGGEADVRLVSGASLLAAARPAASTGQD